MRLFNKMLKAGAPCGTFTPAAFIIVPLMARVYVYTLGSEALTPDMGALAVLRGVGADLALGLLAAALVCALPVKRSFRLALCALWATLMSLNAAHIIVNQSHANAQFMHLLLRREFISGSLLALSNALIVLAVSGAAIIAAYLLGKTRLILRPLVLMGLSAGIGSLSLLLPLDLGTPEWIQTSVLEANVRNALNRPVLATGLEMPPRLLERFHPRDLSGMPMFHYPESKQNVLIFLMEGVSLDKLNSTETPFLSGLLERGVSYRNFLTSQRQTNRGLFALLCGEPPNLLTTEAKSDYYGMYGAPLPCLPERLALNGYHTSFMQGAGLGYMGKDLFAKAAGFHEKAGDFDFKAPLGRNGWGIDDLSLAREVLNKAKGLSGEGRPWFITALTSGTHHPYNVPHIKVPEYRDALSYLDNAIAELISGLETEGILEDTLVLLTSDEGADNHAPLIALLPEATSPSIVEGYFGQTDIQISLLDYLGIPVGASRGRSIFRAYDTGRTMVLGNVYQNKAYKLDTSTGRLVMCSTLTYQCIGNGMPLGKDSPEARDLLAFMYYSDINSDKLAGLPLFTINSADYEGANEIMGDRKVVLNKGDTLRFELSLMPDGPLMAMPAFDGTYTILNKQYIGRKGEPIEVDFSYTSKQDRLRLNLNLQVLTFSPDVSYRINRLLLTKTRAASQ